MSYHIDPEAAREAAGRRAARDPRHTEPNRDGGDYTEADHAVWLAEREAEAAEARDL